MAYAAKIPSHFKPKGKYGKHIFKKALKQFLPDDILYRRKMGFGVPVEEWLRKDLKDYGGDMLRNGAAGRPAVPSSAHAGKILERVPDRAAQPVHGAVDHHDADPVAEDFF